MAPVPTRSVLIHDAGDDLLAQLEDVDSRLRSTIADSLRLHRLIEFEMDRRGTDDYSGVLGGILAFASAVRELREVASQPGADLSSIALAGAAQLAELDGEIISFAQAVRDLQESR